MSAAAQSLVVFAIVVAAIGYASVTLMPAAWRRSLAARVAALAKRSGASDVLARRVEAKLSSGGACGSCDSCKACASTATGDAFAEASATPMRRIPIRRA